MVLILVYYGFSLNQSENHSKQRFKEATEAENLAAKIAATSSTPKLIDKVDNGAGFYRFCTLKVQTEKVYHINCSREVQFGLNAASVMIQSFIFKNKRNVPFQPADLFASLSLSLLTFCFYPFLLV